MNGSNLEEAGQPQGGGDVYQYGVNNCSIDGVLYKGMFALQLIQTGCLIAVAILLGHGAMVLNEWYYP